ncbi:MAG: carbon-nitrogen hydrolase family protein, partial [Deltaproteobacteria bacterium]|nr:carbon-nitrogen hydrolase family protein [Deltaproteobacteria bacterium]
MSAELYRFIEVGDPKQPGTTLAAVNMRSEFDKERNLRKYLEIIEIAASKKVGLLVFPETSLQGYLYQLAADWTLSGDLLEYQYANAEPIPGRVSEVMAEQARKHSMHIVYGFTEKNERYGGGYGNLFNSAAVIGPTGIVGVFRKIHIPGGERHCFRSGAEMELYETTAGRLGIQICYDICFPEVSRVYAVKGADILVLPTAWPTSGDLTVYDTQQKEYGGAAYDLFCRVRALENQTWLLAAGHTGTDPKECFTFYGHSKIVHPSGLVIAETGAEEGMAIAYGVDVKGEVLRTR